MLFPVISDGFIDYDTMFKLVVGKLKQPISSLNDLTVHEISLLTEQYEIDFEEHYELIALAVQLGYVNANTKGKNKTLFNRKSSKPNHNKKVTKEEKDKELNELMEFFNVHK